MYSEVFCRVYNQLGWNYYPEIFGQQLLLWLQRKGLAPKTAMDLACGTGVLCRLLQENGIRASGMDLSEGMIRIAKETSPEISYQVADMIRFCPQQQYELVTCTGDALNHIHSSRELQAVFQNIYRYTAPGGVFVCDILNQREVSDSEPFRMDYDSKTRVWFQMTRPAEDQVNLKIRVYEEDVFAFEENIRETIHPPELICRLLEDSGFVQVRCSDRLLEDSGAGTTWFVVARKGQGNGQEPG